MGRLIIDQFEFDTIARHIPIDIIVCSSGFESRASFIAQKLSTASIPYKYAIAFKDLKDTPSRKKNDKIFKNLGYKIIDNDKDSTSFISTIIGDITKLKGKDQINILIDYSSMSRSWFGIIVGSISIFPDNVNLFFSYSKSKFDQPSPFEAPSIKFDPIPGFNHLSIPDRPTALIIGLGYEKDRAGGLIEYFDAEEIFLFHTDNEAYKKHIRKANHALFEQVSAENIIPYPIDDIGYTYTILRNLCEDLNTDYRLIIASCGPKPFSILSFIIATQLRFIDIWRISGESNPKVENRFPTGEIITFGISKMKIDVI